MTYELFFNSVRGASHIKKDIPCEDFGLKADHGEFKIFAVADGHGDPNCLRSSIGSEYICKIAAEELEDFARSVKDQGWTEKLFSKTEFEPLFAQLITSIVGKWSIAIGEELNNNPLTEEELARAPVFAEEFRKGIKPERMYGTTLIAGLQTDKYLLLIQQGDGRCAVFDSNGDVSQPIPWDDRCFANATTSLCDDDAVESFRYHVIDLEKDPIIACIAGTDGVEDSFPTSMDKTHSYYRKILKFASENSIEALENILPEALSNLSATGSADDVTISGIIDLERTRMLLTKFESDNRIIDLRDELTLVESKIYSIEDGGKFEYLKSRYLSSKAEYETAEKTYSKLTSELKSLEDLISAHEQKIPSEEENFSTEEDNSYSNKKIWELLEHIRNMKLSQHYLSFLKQDHDRKAQQLELAKAHIEQLSAKLEAAENEFLPYKEKYDDLLKQREHLREELNKTI